MSLSLAVVPGYYLVCYNLISSHFAARAAVVPGYYLVCYNETRSQRVQISAVVPGYYLVCYNKVDFDEVHAYGCSSRLLLGML